MATYVFGRFQFGSPRAKSFDFGVYRCLVICTGE